MVDNEGSLWRQIILPSLSLFMSAGTLLCCAFPALLVTLGMGAALAGLVGSAPWIIAISDYKEIVFVAAGVLIVLAGVMQWRARNAPCPVDPAKAKACSRLRKINWIILGVAASVYAVGFFFAFAATYIAY